MLNPVGGFLSRNTQTQTSTPATSSGGSRSTTPTPGNPASDAANGLSTAPVAKSGMLRIRVTSARELSLPPNGVLSLTDVSLMAQSLSLCPSKPLSRLIPHLPRLSRHDPTATHSSDVHCGTSRYAVLEFDKNEVLVEATAGDLANPVWMYVANFDVSRKSDVTVQAYLRTAQPTAQSKDSNGVEMGSDLSLGGIRFTPQMDNVSTELSA